MSKNNGLKLTPTFERTVALLLAKRSKFYGMIGYAIDPSLLAQETNQLVVKAVRAIAKDLGHGPSDEMLVIQRLRTWVEDGMVTQEQLDDVIDLFLDAPSKLPPEAEVIAELQPLLRRRMEADAVRTAMDVFAKRGDFDEVTRIFDKAKAIGRQDTSAGLRLGAGAFMEIERLRNMDRLPLGIPELDMGLDSGMPRGCLGVYVGGPGAGKSMFLAHTVSQAVKRGMFVTVATLELNRAAWMARVMANLTGEPIAKIMSADFASTQARIEKMYPVLGTLIVQDFPAKLTTMRHLIDWNEKCGEEEGHRAHLFVSDYADKCSSHLKDDAGNTYAGQGTVYETKRLYCLEKGIWGLTASQPRRAAGKEKKRRIEIDDLADSQEKARVADLLVALMADGDQIEYGVPKFRYGKSGFTVGPLPHDWACGRMIMMEDEP